MKTLKQVAALTLTVSFLAAPLIGFAADAKKPKPYPLDTCLVSGEKLDAMGKPYVFVHQGREIKLCCKSCLKDFNKDTVKYVKKLDEAGKKGPK